MFRVVLVNILFFIVCVLHGQTFAEMQLRNARVYSSMRNADKTLRKEFEKAGVSYPPRFIYWRSFKTEKQLELWASDDPYKPHVLIKTYDICRLSGRLGFKFREGDEQIPKVFITSIILIHTVIIFCLSDCLILTEWIVFGASVLT